MTTHDGKVDFEIKQGDRSPVMTVTCKDGDDPVNLTSATEVRLLGTLFTGRTPGSTLEIDRVVTGDAEGKVLVEWEEAETAEAGDLLMEVQVTLANGKPQTFPREGKILVRVYDDVNVTA